MLIGIACPEFLGCAAFVEYSDNFYTVIRGRVDIMRPFARTLLTISIARSMAGGTILLLILAEDKSYFYISLAIFIGAQISDNIDGWIVRKYSNPSIYGYLQDSIADKIFHAGCLIGLSYGNKIISCLLFLFIIREFLILSVRILSNDVNLSLTTNKKYSVAYATALRVGLLLIIFSKCIAGFWSNWLGLTGLVLIIVAAFLGLISIFQAKDANYG